MKVRHVVVEDTVLNEFLDCLWLQRIQQKLLSLQTLNRDSSQSQQTHTSAFRFNHERNQGFPSVMPQSALDWFVSTSGIRHGSVNSR